MRGMVLLLHDPLPSNRRLSYLQGTRSRKFATSQSHNEGIWNNNLQFPKEEPPRLNVNACCRPGEEIYIRSGI